MPLELDSSEESYAGSRKRTPHERRSTLTRNTALPRDDRVLLDRYGTSREKTMSLRTELIAATAIACGLAGGCATEGPPPSEELTRAQTVIDQADKAGVQRYAAADLQRAHDELSNAERANGEGKYDEARRCAE